MLRASRGTPSLSTFRVFPRVGNFQYRIGWVDPSVGQLVWPSPPVDWVFDGFDYGSGWGGLDSFSQLLVAADPSRAEVTTL